MARRRKSKDLSGVIRRLYRMLSVVNTVSVVASGNPAKIAKHVARKRSVKFGAKLVK